MPSENWTPTVIYTPLMEEAKEIAKRKRFPNITQYVNQALREKVEEDKSSLGETQQ